MTQRIRQDLHKFIDLIIDNKKVEYLHESDIDVWRKCSTYISIQDLIYLIEEKKIKELK
jgi:hypothetical protein